MSQSLAPPLPLPLVVPQASAKPTLRAEERALAGESAGWNELIRKHNRQVVLVLLSQGIRPDTARDLAQDAWARLIEQQRLGRLTEIKMPGLITKQALFLARDHTRTEKHHDGHEAAEQQITNPMPQLLARERLQQARRSLTQCSEMERRVFCAMFDTSCTSASDVARLTGLSVQRVRQINCEVRTKLREAMKDHSHE